MSMSNGSSTMVARAPQTRHVQWGDTVRTHVCAWLEDGTIVHRSPQDEPMTFTTGDHAVFSGMEELVIGMTVGESRSEKIPVERAFGPHRAELTGHVSTAWLQTNQVSPAIGLGLDVQTTDGTVVPMVITHIDGERVTLDANHRLAGRAVYVQVEIIEILEPDASGGGRYPNGAE